MRVIDLSGAWRLTDAANRAVYAFEDSDAKLAAETQAQAVYGMPELHRARLAGARLIANPGCYATPSSSRSGHWWPPGWLTSGAALSPMPRAA